MGMIWVFVSNTVGIYINDLIKLYLSIIYRSIYNVCVN